LAVDRKKMAVGGWPMPGRRVDSSQEKMAVGRKPCTSNPENP
jgi:hypothetical protein